MVRCLSAKSVLEVVICAPDCCSESLLGHRQKLWVVLAARMSSQAAAADHVRLRRSRPRVSRLLACISTTSRPAGDGVVWGGSGLVPVPGGARTPFGVLPMTAAELAEHTARIAAYGVTTVPEVHNQNATLAWLLYTATATVGRWERFRPAVVEIGAV